MRHMNKLLYRQMQLLALHPSSAEERLISLHSERMSNAKTGITKRLPHSQEQFC